MTENLDWEEVFQPETQIRIKDGGHVTAHFYFETPQTIEITDTSDVEDKGRWPQALTLKGTPKNREKLIEIPLDNLFIREAVARGDAKILKE